VHFKAWIQYNAKMVYMYHQNRQNESVDGSIYHREPSGL